MKTADSIHEYRRLKRVAILTCVILPAVVCCYTWWQLEQLLNGQLFLFPLAGELPPSPFELYDAKESARLLRIPAMVCVAILGGLLSALVLNWEKVAPQNSRFWKLLTGVLIASTIFDLITTINFFREQGIHLEIHPGIRLIGYAYGRTVGPLLGKSLQLLLILGVSRILGKTGFVIIVLAIVMYFAGGLYNLSQS